MYAPSSLTTWTVTVFFLFVFNAVSSGQSTPTITSPDAGSELTELLYSIEDFRSRLTQALDANEAIGTNQNDRIFIKGATEYVSTTALDAFRNSIQQLIGSLNVEEVDSLIVVLKGPYGSLLRKAFILDNTYVESRLATYANESAAAGLAEMEKNDSLLFAKDFRYDLRTLMDGKYTDERVPTYQLIITDNGKQHTETFGDNTFNFDVNWQSNSKYAIADGTGNPFSVGGEMLVNVYAIEGDHIDFMTQMPDGNYRKTRLLKTEYSSYTQEITTFQWGLNDQYASATTSPLPDTARVKFAAGPGHPFFPLNEALNIEADFTEKPDSATITMPTSAGTEVTYRVYGTASFTLEGKPVALDLYQQITPGTEGKVGEDLFLPFRDATSGEVTYGGGRYMEVKMPENGKVRIDFNKAYHPYCAYTDGYACPVPPRQNTIAAEVNAGIKL